ncbi:MAG: TIGR01777 family oxidoreductase [Abitibacteriaceae bacterium]|nr:TIGR01777 family oxidoreductase [Abditibacteriaceae bacterium]
MKIIIPGGTGQVGSLLADFFYKSGHEVVVLSRQGGHPLQYEPWQIATWDAATLGDWATHLEGSDVVINLAGRSVNCRYNAANRQAIMESRVNSTRVIGEAIAQAAHPPRLWLQASTAAIYAHRYDAPNDELTGILGGDEPNVPDTWRFSIDVAKAWEKTLDEAVTPHTRKVKLRSAMVMSPDAGGVFDVLLGLVRRGLGGWAGNGRQYVSWIHYQDFLHSIQWLIEHEQLEGAINITAPNPLPNAQFMSDLRKAWGASFGLSATEWILEIGTFFMHTETELVLKSRRVIPTRLLQSGFTFQFPTWPTAARDLCQQWRERRKAIE